MLGLSAACLVVAASVGTLTAFGAVGYNAAAFSMVSVNAVCALMAAAALALSVSNADGRRRAVSVWLATGCAVWGVGAVPFLAFLIVGGDVTAPAAWSQVGFLAAYAPWFRALWLLRQPVLADSRARVWETITVEVAAFMLVAAVVLSLLWHHPWSVSANIAQLTPTVLDMLLIAATYNTVRRASLSHGSAYTWLVAGFALMAVADALGSVALSRGYYVAVSAPLALYCVVFALLAISAGRPLQLRESALAGERVTVAVVAIGMSVLGPAAFLAPPLLSPIVWFVGAGLAWRLHALVRRQNVSDQDLLTGLYETRALLRHANGMIAGCSEREQVGMVAVDICEFGTWNAAHGFTAGDALLVEVAERLASTPMGPGLWARIGPDRFCWVGRVDDPVTARKRATAAVDAARENHAGLPARCALVICPGDADTAENAVAAAEEALEAAKAARRPLVAFDRGMLDGTQGHGTWSASYRSRRERVMAVINDVNSLHAVYQPIVRIDTLAIVGYEALSRVQAKPRRSPDLWIAEAKHVALGLEFESECIRRALLARPYLPAGAYLSLNASPDLILSGRLDDLMPVGPLDWLLIEITEHEQVRDYGELGATLNGLRSRGARVAVDDLGSGHSTLRHVMKLNPDYAKLDRSLIEGIHLDPAKQALVRSMVAFSHEMSCVLVAEGIETPHELAMLRAIGMELGQGYLFQRPTSRMTRSVPPLSPADRAIADAPVAPRSGDVDARAA